MAVANITTAAKRFSILFPNDLIAAIPAQRRVVRHEAQLCEACCFSCRASDGADHDGSPGGVRRDHNDEAGVDVRCQRHGHGDVLDQGRDGSPPRSN